MPLGMSLTKVTDQAVNIRRRVDEFMLKFFVALLVVMLVSFVSMGWRVGLVVAAAVPLTLAAVFVVMAATGKNFDRITLGSLILALGLLVDDAIIAIEMMVVKMEEGYGRVAASAYAWSHTAAPMLAGTLVTAVGFMPIGFARSTAGEYTSNMFWIVGIALIASWVVAVVFTPYLGVKLLPDFKKVEGGHDAIYDTPRYNRFRRVLGRVIARKWLGGRRWWACSARRRSAWAWSRSSSSPSPTVPKCWSRCRCPMAPRSRRPAPPRRRSRPGWRNRRKPRSSPPTSARARRASIWRWRRNCPIRRSPRSWSARTARRQRDALKLRLRRRSPTVLRPKRGCASRNSCSARIRRSRSPSASAVRIPTSCAASRPGRSR